MSKLSAFAIVLSVIGSAAFAYDSDPGYGQRGDSTASPRAGSRSTAPQYVYKPTMRYYGKDYVVTYRFVQWNEKMNRGVATSFEGAQHSMSAGAMQAAPGQEPRVTYYRSATSSVKAPSAAVQPTRSTAPVVPAKDVPAISSSTAKKN